MKFYIDQKVKDKYPELDEVLMPVFGVKVVKDESILTDQDFKSEVVLTEPEILAFREFFASFKVNIKKTPPSVEHLYQRFFKTGRVPHINNVVDVCNKVAVQTLIPTGVFDLDKVKGDMVMRYTREGEEFHEIGGDIEKLPAGLVVIADEEKILNLFPARDSIYQNVTEETKNVMILADKVAGVDLSKTKAAVEQIGDMLVKLAGGQKGDIFTSQLMEAAMKKPEKRVVHFRNIATDIMKKAKITYRFVSLPEDLPLDVPAHVQFHGITLKQAVPTMIFKTEKRFIAAQRRADTKVNFKKLKELAGVSQLALASEEEMASLGCEYGVVPLVGLPMAYFVDKAVTTQKEIVGGSGERLFALSLSAHDLVKVNNATVGDFCDLDETAGRKKRVFSGSRPTGRLHLGNYLGAIKGYIELQNRNDLDCIYSVVDLHGITTPYDKINFAKGVQEVVLDYLGAGLDPKKCHVMVQSAMRGEVLELAYYFATIFPVSRVEDLPTYKEKKAQHPDYVNVGLLYYPILMAADILFAKAELVPVGVDQEPHIELTREVARKFNQMFGDTFAEPKRFDTPGRYVPSLTGEGKMSKSVEGSYINLSDDFETIKNKLAKAVTDEGKGEKFPETGSAANLVTLVELFEGRDRAQQYREMYKVSCIKYQVLKDELAKAIYDELKPIQERRKYFEEHPDEVVKILDEGKNYARQIAKETLEEVREKMGLVPD